MAGGPLLLLLAVSVLTASCRTCAAAANSQHQFRGGKPNDSLPSASTAVFKVNGNVYPDGVYYVTVYIGNPPKPYFLDIDTGSDLTWLQCDAPCVSCTAGLPHPLYKPNKQKLVHCEEDACKVLHSQHPFPCNKPDDQCDYQVEYADYGSSLGVLVRDGFVIQLANGSVSQPQIAFGCGYDQRSSTQASHAPMDGILGVGTGKASLVSQLNGQGLTRNVIGHCFGSKGGYLYFGDGLIPRGVTWTPLSRNQYGHYAAGPANLILGKPANGVKDLTVVFDSGSSYTYFSDRPYRAVVSSVTKDLSAKFKEAKDDKTLPLCWKGPKRLRNVADIRKYAKLLSLVLSFGKTAQLEIPPEGYLIISGQGNVCLGILNGAEVGLGNLNIIGDVSMQNLVVIYDNENQQIGWAPADCSRLPNAEDEEGFTEGFTEPYRSVIETLY